MQKSLDETLKDKSMFKNLAFYNNRYHLYTECVKHAIDSNDHLRCDFIKGRLSNMHKKIGLSVHDLLFILNNNKSVGHNGEFLSKTVMDNMILRKNLQNELDGLYVNEESGKPYNFAIESGILWILLTTTCVYFVIVKL